MDLNLYALELLARDRLARARAEAALHASVARHATPRDRLDGHAVTVRDAAEADLAQITAIWNHEVLGTDATTDTEPRNARAEREWFDRHPAPYPVVVAATGGAVLAFGSLSPYRPKPAFARTVEDSVYVERRHRGGGLGGLILAELIRRARAYGYRSVLARITSGNRASIRLHTRHGFRLVGVERQVAIKRGTWLDVTIMQLRL